MAASSNHYGDVFNWVMKVIDSCDQYPQIFTAHRLVDNFCSTKYPTLEWFEKSNLNSQLIHAVHNKQRELLNKKYDNGFTGSGKND
jgi:hypothetical protein